MSIPINQLNLSIKTRQKRGIINGLGSIIKAITGNLKTILKNNQEKIKGFMQNPGKIQIQYLTHKQLLIENTIDQIENILRELESNSIGTYYYFFIEMTISQLISEFQLIYDLLEEERPLFLSGILFITQ